MGVGVETRRWHQRVRGNRLTPSRSVLRVVDSEQAIGSAIALAREYGAWAIDQAKREYGIDAQAESGHGLGRQLLEQLLADARALEFRLIRLESAVFMLEAHALYRSAGFTDVPPYEGREFADIPGAAEIQVFMALQLEEHT